MAATGGQHLPALKQTATTIREKLQVVPQAFDFFQLVRLIETMAAEDSSAEGSRRRTLGSETRPSEETIRFRAYQSRCFPASAVVRWDPAPVPGKSSKSKPGSESATQRSGESSTGLNLGTTDPGATSAAAASGSPQSGEGQSTGTVHDQRRDLVVAFLAMTGPSGVLPQHYSQLIMDRVRRKDFALRDFLDLFNHRAISLFYRAWRKYRLPIAYEEIARGTQGAADLAIIRSLWALVGFANGRWGNDPLVTKLRNRLEFSDDWLVYFSGTFSHRRPMASQLGRMLSEVFQLPVQVLQFQGQWLNLDPSEQSRPGGGPWGGLQNSLGVETVVGSRVWSVDTKFRLKIGPVPLDLFRKLSPAGKLLKPLCQMTRLYVGQELDFEVQPVLKACDVPKTQLASGASGSHLGWDSWLISQPRSKDGDEAVFVDDGRAVRKSTPSASQV